MRDEALRLKAEGLSVRQIAVRLGVPRGTVGDWVKPRKACPDCGGELGAHPGERCISCDKARREAYGEETLALVERLYNAGASHAEITRELGWPETSKPGYYLKILRQQGRIGYRNNGYGEAA